MELMIAAAKQIDDLLDDGECIGIVVFHRNYQGFEARFFEAPGKEEAT
jgi:hypothetical protein